MEEYPTNYYHKCGHQARFTAITPENQERILEAYEKAKDRDCHDCAANLKEYGFYPISNGELVELQGSEKQVAWSIKIRKDFIDLANIRIKDSKRRGATEDDAAKMRRIFISIFNQQSSAKFWIDNRYDTLKIFDPAWQKALAKES